ncbi:MAG: CotH kinase family protein [Bacteroidales bacterium]|nr:CotH kinase family protein [Bacteroidales bacterium]
MFLAICVTFPLFCHGQDDTVSFSRRGGVYANAFSVSLSCQSPTHHIRYTLNGSTPDQNSILYTSPVMLSTKLCTTSDIYKIPISPADEFYLPDSVTKAIVIRAAAFDDMGNRVSRVVTQSYFISSLGCTLHGLPVVSICADSLALFDHDTGILVPGVHLDPDDPKMTGNYAQEGRAWERLINIEYYTDGNNGFNQAAGLRTHGGILARRAQQKGLKIYAREEYGKKNFKYRIFEETDLKKFKHLILKPFRNACTPAGVHDWLANHIASELDMEFTATRPVTLFLNGEYWGIYFIQEKIDDRYIEGHFDIDHDSVNVINCWGELESGSSDSWYSLYYSLWASDLSDPDQYYHYSRQIDLHNFIDYYIFELFSANWDWPCNNVRCWQTSDGSPWRWVFYDGDCCFDSSNPDMYGYATYTGPQYWPSCTWSTLFFRKFLENESFKNQFLHRLEAVNSNHFSYKHTKKYLDKIRNLLREEIPQQSQRFNNPKNMNEWEQACQYIDDFLARRENQFWDETKTFFHLGDDHITSVKGYPNPMLRGEKLNLMITTEEESTVGVSIYDINGRFLKGQYIFLEQGENIVSLDVGFLTGVIVVKIGKHSEKVIILPQ